MIRLSISHLAIVGFLLVDVRPGPCQENHKEEPYVDVKQITRDELGEASSSRNTAVFGSLAEEKNGHIVAFRNRDRVWDGNTLGGLKDIRAGIAIENDKVTLRMGLFLKDEFPNETADIWKAQRKDWPAKIKAYLANATDDQKQQFLDRYVDKGAPLSHSWEGKYLDKIQYYQVPTDRNVKDVIKNYQPPRATNPAMENLRCNDLALKVAPVLRTLVAEEIKPGKGQRVAEPNANNIDSAFKSRAIRYTNDPDATDYVVLWRKANGTEGESHHATLNDAQKEAKKLFQGNKDLTEVGQSLRIVSVTIKGRQDKTPDFGPGTYSSDTEAGKGTLKLMGDGTAEYTIRNLRVTGIWKVEKDRLLIQWRGGDFRGEPKWHDSTDEMRKAKRIGD